MYPITYKALHIRYGSPFQNHFNFLPILTLLSSVVKLLSIPQTFPHTALNKMASFWHYKGFIHSSKPDAPFPTLVGKRKKPASTKHTLCTQHFKHVISLAYFFQHISYSMLSSFLSFFHFASISVH